MTSLKSSKKYPPNPHENNNLPFSNKTNINIFWWKGGDQIDQLAIKAKAGDKKATEEIITRLQPLIISSIRKYYNNRNEYDDLIQDGNLKILECIRDYDPTKGVHFLGYVQTILRYLYLDKHKIKIHTSLNQTIGQGDTEIIDLLVSEDKETLELIIEEESNTELKQALDKLTERQRQILLLYYDERMGMHEIATKLGISYRTVVNTKGTALINMKKNIIQKSSDL